MAERKKLLMIDGNSVLNRAFYGVRPMTTKDGRPTNAIYGFLTMILKQLDALSPDAVGIAFDLKAPTFRHKKCDFYKANRKGMPEELAAQLPYAKDISKLLGFHVLSLEGYEADDILGTAAAKANKSGEYECYIMTGDRDSFQLIDGFSYVLFCSNNDTELYDAAKFAEKYGGLSPRQLIDLKALMGDSSDNIPGVAGIGEKTAIKLISEYQSLDGLYEKYEASDLSKGIKEKLANGKEMAYMSRFLAEIFLEVPLPLDYPELIRKSTDRDGLLELLSDLELKSIIKRLGYDNTASSSAGGKNAEQKNAETALSLFDETNADDTAYTRFTDYTEAESVPVLSGEVGVYPDFTEKRLYIDCDAGTYIIPLNEKNITDVFTEDIKTVVFDSKEIIRFMLENALPTDSFNCSFDVMLAQYVVYPKPLDGIFDIITGHDSSGYYVFEKEQKLLCAVRLLRTVKKELSARLTDDGLENVYYKIELPLAKTLAHIEAEGFYLDKNGIAEYGKQLDKRVSERMQNIYSLAECEFNINSPKQLGDVLYGKLSLPTYKKTKSGFSTDAETLEKLRPFHPIINEILDYRTVSKLKGTYVEGLLKECGDKDRVHTTFKQALTLTGRLSSTEPNLQNIPIRTAEGRELRKFFIAPEGKVLIDADYSQIELRILAALSGDTAMCRTFLDGNDIHSMTASQVFGVPIESVTPEMRKSAKAVNFGIVYGISDFSLAGDIGTTRKQAAEYIEKYFSTYPAIREYLDALIDFGIKHGYVTTLFGRRRYIPELAAQNKNMQAFGKRVAMNSPIQGTAADIIKMAMINTENALRAEKLSAKLILQVHDELIVECPEAETEKVCGILRYQMEHCVGEDFPVPLEVSLSYGKSWFEAHV